VVVSVTLNLKPDYIDAYILLSQIAKNEGNNEDAVGYAEVALSLYPDNKDLSAYVDALKNSKSSTVTPPPSTPAPSTSTNTTNSPVKGKK
jgi:tetratricopeptide (TPR) repeat protein